MACDERFKRKGLVGSYRYIVDEVPALSFETGRGINKGFIF